MSSFEGLGEAVRNAVAEADEAETSINVTAGPVTAKFPIPGIPSVELGPKIALSAVLEEGYVSPAARDATQVNVSAEAGEGVVVGGSVSTVNGRWVGGSVSAGLGVSYPIPGEIKGVEVFKLLEKIGVSLPTSKEHPEQR